MKKKRLEKSGLLTFSDFSDLLTQSGRRTVNSDSFIINDLNKKGTWRVHLKDFGVSQNFFASNVDSQHFKYVHKRLMRGF